MGGDIGGQPMTKRDDLIALAERVEALEGPCRETDALVRLAVYAPFDAVMEQSPINGLWCIYHGVDRVGRPRLWEGPGRGAHYTASLDAAMTLVPDDLECELTRVSPSRDPRFGRFQVRISLFRYEDDPEELGALATANAATLALAITAAALRALAAMETTDE
jgi:hypothetical protein